MTDTDNRVRAANARAEAETEAGRACSLVGEIVDARSAGDRESIRGNADDDLLAAFEDARDAIATAIDLLQF